MNKKSKIVLIVLITTSLVLAVVLPALARKPIETDPNCIAWAVIVNKSGVYDRYAVYGALDAYWENGVLYNYCTGIIPWGDETDRPGWRFATFNESCEYFGDRVTCDKNTATTTPDQWGNDVPIYDPETEDTYDTWVFYAISHRNGEFLFYKEYTPEE
jgi:hypothetical protein